MAPLIQDHRKALRDLCRVHGVKRLAAFGSVVRGELKPGSDVDFLIEFTDVETPGYADRFMDFAEAAEKLLGRPVDLLTARSLENPYLRRRIEAEAVELLNAT